MLIRKEHTENGALLGIWKMDESKEELLQLFLRIFVPKPIPI